MTKFIFALLLVLLAFSSFTDAANVTKTPCPKTPSQICPLFITQYCVYPRCGKPYTVESNPCLICKNKKIKATSIGACP